MAEDAIYSLGEHEQQPARRGLHVLTSNYTMPALLARGVLLPAALEHGGEVPSLDAWGLRLPSDLGGLAAASADAVSAAARNAFPIALRLKSSSGVRRLRLDEAQGCLEYILLEDVEAVVFRSESERDLFASWGFENVPADGGQTHLAVDAGIFAKAGPGRRATPAGGEIHFQTSSLADGLRRADAVAALLAVAIRHGAERAGWLDCIGQVGAARQSPVRVRNSWLLRLVEGVRARSVSDESDLDAGLLVCAVSVMLRRPYVRGWPAGDVLEEIERGVLAWLSRAQLPGGEVALRAWASHCHAVLAGRAQPPVLSDDKSIVRRAILLLLLRGTVEETERTPTDDPESGLVVGPVVRLLALGLAAARCGLRSLPSEYKSVQYDGVVQDLRPCLALAFVSELGRCCGTVRSRVGGVLSATYRPAGVFDGMWELKSGAAAPVRVGAGLDPRLRRFAAMGAKVGAEACLPDPVDVRLEELKLRIRTRDGAAVIVVARVLPVAGSDAGRLTFTVDLGPAVPLAAERGTTGATSTRADRLPRRVLVSLLQEHSRSPRSWRFAISQDGSRLLALAEHDARSLDEAVLGRSFGALCEARERSAVYLTGQE